ncbi:MAG TPA: shikimate dehydrogenase, partial [Solirubrobacterales bacterium]|nr:shikimate dehydrogenase [Solirubrobacterales bacterium]
MPSLAVIGHPVAHTRSPDMQTAALAELGLAGEWTYGAIDVDPESFEVEVAELAAAGDYAGVNVTLPHKEAALAIADEASEGARAIGAANTLTFSDGRIAAANTDAGG